VESLILRLHGNIEEIKAKALRKFSIVYSLFNSGQLSANIKLPLHKALTRSVMADASPPGNSWQTCLF